MYSCILSLSTVSYILMTVSCSWALCNEHCKKFLGPESSRPSEVSPTYVLIHESCSLYLGVLCIHITCSPEFRAVAPYQVQLLIFVQSYSRSYPLSRAQNMGLQISFMQINSQRVPGTCWYYLVQLGIHNTYIYTYSIHQIQIVESVQANIF
jgi:hypothetical protein